jgi:hypothetical protein
MKTIKIMKTIKNIDDLRNSLLDQNDALIENKLSLSESQELSNIRGKIISATALELKQRIFLKDKTPIPFLNAEYSKIEKNNTYSIGKTKPKDRFEELQNMGVEIEVVRNGYIVNEAYFVSKTKKTWRRLGTDKWYGFSSIKDFVIKYVN